MRPGPGRRRRVAVAAALLALLASTGCVEVDTAGSGDATPQAADARQPTPGEAGTGAAAPADDEDETMTERRTPSIDRRSSSGSVRVETDDAVATPGSRAGVPGRRAAPAPAPRDAVVEDAAAEACRGAGFDLARTRGADVELVAGYASVLGAFADWTIVDGTSTQSVSVVDTTRPDDAPVALCYYDGTFDRVPGRDVSRIGVLVSEDGDARVVLRGRADRLGLHVPPDA